MLLCHIRCEKQLQAWCRSEVLQIFGAYLKDPLSLQPQAGTNAPCCFDWLIVVKARMLKVHQLMCKSGVQPIGKECASWNIAVMLHSVTGLRLRRLKS